MDDWVIYLTLEGCLYYVNEKTGEKRTRLPLLDWKLVRKRKAEKRKAEKRKAEKEKETDSAKKKNEPDEDYDPLRGAIKLEDWELLQSSSGKIYYRNSKTSKSQWEPPFASKLTVLEERVSDLRESIRKKELSIDRLRHHISYYQSGNVSAPEAKQLDFDGV